MKKSIAIVVSSPMMVNFFLIEQLNYLTNFFIVTLITGESDKDVTLNKDKFSNLIKIVTVNTKRKIAIFSDIAAFFILVKVFYKNKFDIVHSVSPKSGLLAQLAAFFLGIDNRVHTFTGQVWANKSGLWYYLLKSVDLLIVKISTDILVDSYSQRSFLMSENVVSHDNSRVLLNGSISGVNDKRFTTSLEIYQSFRESHNLESDIKIILFIGRLTQDKGVIDLLHAFNSIAGELKKCHLFLVGPDEDNIVKNYVTNQEYQSRIMYFNYTNKPEYFMQISDILCLPSSREGFGNVVLEAALCGIPAVVSDIYGLRDVVEKDVTASIFSTGDVDGLSSALIDLVNNQSKRLKMGKDAHDRANRLFSGKAINDELTRFYQELLNNNSRV
jgi:glycosyltransferase involved in cell wall biosynthesis